MISTCVCKCAQFGFAFFPTEKKIKIFRIIKKYIFLVGLVLMCFKQLLQEFKGVMKSAAFLDVDSVNLFKTAAVDVAGPGGWLEKCSIMFKSTC